MENLHSFSKYKISAADRYTSFLLPILLIIVDYIAVVSAEQVAFVIRNFLIPDGGYCIFLGLIFGLYSHCYI